MTVQLLLSLALTTQFARVLARAWVTSSAARYYVRVLMHETCALKGVGGKGNVKELGCVRKVTRCHAVSAVFLFSFLPFNPVLPPVQRRLTLRGFRRPCHNSTFCGCSETETTPQLSSPITWHRNGQSGRAFPPQKNNPLI